MGTMITILKPKQSNHTEKKSRNVQSPGADTNGLADSQVCGTLEFASYLAKLY